MISVQKFEFNPFQENTYIVFSESREAVIIDPGCYDAHEKDELDSFIEQNNLSIKYLLNTHCHIDHVLGNDHVKEKYKVPLYIHPIEEPYLKAVKTYASNYGFAHFRETSPDRFFQKGDQIAVGDDLFEVLFLPGHAPGHVGLYHAEQKILFSGDVLFKSSIGRTDLPGGDHNTLLSSIRETLFILPDDVVVYPGHGPETTIGEEKISNPFCAINL